MEDSSSSSSSSSRSSSSSDMRANEVEDVVRLGLGLEMWSRSNSGEYGGARLGVGGDGTALLSRSARRALGCVESLSAGAKAVVGRVAARSLGATGDEWIRCACGYGAKACGRAKCVRHVLDPRDRLCEEERRRRTREVAAELVAAGAAVAAPSNDGGAATSDRRDLARRVAESRALTNEQRRAWLAATGAKVKRTGRRNDYVAAIVAHAGQRGILGSPPLWAPLAGVLRRDGDEFFLLRLEARASAALRRARRLLCAIVDGGDRAASERAGANFFEASFAGRLPSRLGFADYAIRSRRYPVFASRSDFECWEAAVELRAAQDACVEDAMLDASRSVWERRRARRLASIASARAERAKLPEDLARERRAQRQRAKRTAQAVRNMRERGALDDDTLADRLRAAFGADLDDGLREPPRPAARLINHDNDSTDDDAFDGDESFSARNAAVGRVLACSPGGGSGVARYGLWAVACLRRRARWRRLNSSSRSEVEAPGGGAEDVDWEGPFGGLDASLVLVEVALRGVSCPDVTGTLEDLAGEDDKAARWRIVEILRFLAHCCSGGAGASLRGRVLSRLSVSLGGRNAPRAGRHLDCPRARAALLSAAINDPDLPPEHRVEFEKVLLAKRRRRHSDFPTDVISGGNPLARRVGQKSQLVSRREDYSRLGVDVEEYALEFYAAEGWWGSHCEGRLLRPLATLLLWECLFDDAHAGAFVHPWQTVPRDLFASRRIFRRRRARRLEETLAAIRAASQADLADIVATAYATRFDTRGFAERRVPVALLQALALGLGPTAVAGLLAAFADRFTTSGLPDLLMLRVALDDLFVPPETLLEWLTQGPPPTPDRALLGRGVRDDAARCDADLEAWLRRPLPPAKLAARFETRLVEVKSYNDSLWEGQVVWLEALLEAGVDARLATLPLSTAFEKKKKDEDDETC